MWLLPAARALLTQRPSCNTKGVIVNLCCGCSSKRDLGKFSIARPRPPPPTSPPPPPPPVCGNWPHPSETNRTLSPRSHSISHRGTVRSSSFSSALSNTNMSSSASLVGRILANSVCIAEKSAQICRDIMASGDLGIVEKTGIADLQTKADRSVQDCIVGSLRSNFPGLAVIGEEGDKVGDVPKDWLVKEEDAEALKLKVPAETAAAKLEEITVWVDPLDGTKEYTEGLLDHVTVLIGIAVGKRAVAGVINQPYYNYQVRGILNFN